MGFPACPLEGSTFSSRVTKTHGSVPTIREDVACRTVPETAGATPRRPSDDRAGWSKGFVDNDWPGASAAVSETAARLAIRILMPIRWHLKSPTTSADFHDWHQNAKRTRDEHYGGSRYMRKQRVSGRSSRTGLADWEWRKKKIVRDLLPQNDAAEWRRRGKRVVPSRQPRFSVRRRSRRDSARGRLARLCR